MISLGQIALLVIGVWVAAASGRRCDHVCGPVVGRPASWPPPRLHLALITLMAAGAVTVVLSAINFPNGGGGFTGRTTSVDLSGLAPVRRPAMAMADTAYLPLHGRRLRADVRARAAARRRKARARLGVDPGGGAGGGPPPGPTSPPIFGGLPSLFVRRSARRSDSRPLRASRPRTRSRSSRRR